MSKQTRQRRRDTDVHSISDARESHTDEMRSRMIKYSISMGVRLVCLILVFFVEGWMMWVVIAGAVVLPYFAVILANGGSDVSNIQHSDALVDHVPLREIEQSAPAAEPEPSDEILAGELVEDDEPDQPEQQRGDGLPFDGRSTGSAA